MKIKKLTMERRRNMEAIIFISPWVIGCLMFFVNPIIQSIRLSLSKIVTLNGFVMEWYGFGNYIKAFMWDINFVPMFLNVIKDTFINTPITLVFSLFIAILLNGSIKGRGFFRTVFFLPVLLGSGVVMKELINIGIVSDAMSTARGTIMPESITTYLGPTFSKIVATFFDRITLILWKSGVQIILFLGGLQGISSSLYEASRIDGATEWEMFWRVTLPLMSPVVLLNIVYTIIDSFTDSNNPIVDYILNQSFVNNQFEYGAAMGWIYFMFIFVVTMLIFGIMRTRVYNAGDR